VSRPPVPDLDAFLSQVAGLTDEDCERCPNCGTDGHWMQEVGNRSTWQPFSIYVDSVNGVMPGDYDEYQTGDDVQSLVAAKHGRADAAALELEIGDPAQNALAVLISTTPVRLHLELHDPQALAQARTALGLAKTPTLGDQMTEAFKRRGEAITAAAAHGKETT
jgi:hypothetical protein